MKKLIVLILALAMVFSMAACGEAPAEEPAPVEEPAEAEATEEEPTVIGNEDADKTLVVWSFTDENRFYD